MFYIRATIHGVLILPKLSDCYCELNNTPSLRKPAGCEAILLKDRHVIPPWRDSSR